MHARESQGVLFVLHTGLVAALMLPLTHAADFWVRSAIPLDWSVLTGEKLQGDWLLPSLWGLKQTS